MASKLFSVLALMAGILVIMIAASDAAAAPLSNAVATDDNIDNAIADIGRYHVYIISR